MLAYERREGDTRVLVALNLTAEPARLPLPDWARGLTPRLSTLGGLPGFEHGALILMGDEGVILT